MSVPKELSRLGALRCLDLANNRPRSTPPAFARLTRLRYLGLQNNRLIAREYRCVVEDGPDERAGADWMRLSVGDAAAATWRRVRAIVPACDGLTLRA